VRGAQRAVIRPLPPVHLVGDGLEVPCVDGVSRSYLGLDSAASTPALPAVADRVSEFLPWYSSVHRGAGYKSQVATAAYEEAREAVLAFAGRSGPGDLAIICRNTTEAINHLAYRLRLSADDVVVTTVVEHHANLLPWARVAERRFVECGIEGTFTPEAVVAALDREPKPRLLAITAASNVTGWLPPLDVVIDAAHDRGVPVLVDGAQLAAHAPLPERADFLVFSGHKMYAPFGAGVLVGPRHAFEEGDPYLAGGGAVELVDLDEVVWTEPPEREEAGSPNVIGAVALGAAVGELAAIGWPAIIEHDRALAARLLAGLRDVPGVRVLGPAGLPPAGLGPAGLPPAGLRPAGRGHAPGAGTSAGPGPVVLPMASFVVEGVPHALVAARLSAEFGIGVRHGCFCAHPYLVRLLGLDPGEVDRFREAARRHDRSALPGAVRVSGGLGTTAGDIERFLAALAVVAGDPPPVPYKIDSFTGDYWPPGFDRADAAFGSGAGCSRS
jgi:selenocysteine lyase/cysteine desulfurase